MCNEADMMKLKRDLRAMRQTMATMMAAFSTGGLATGTFMRGGSSGQQPAGACGGPQYCQPDLVSPDTAALIRGGNRVQRVALLSGVAVAPGAADVPVTIASNGLERTLALSDLISSLANLDALLITVSAAGGQVEKFTLNGGVFSRANANACTTSCGYSVCLGSAESVVITVTNQGAAAIAAGSTAVLSLTSIYRGEPGFACGDCVPAGAVGGMGGMEG